MTEPMDAASGNDEARGTSPRRMLAQADLASRGLSFRFAEEDVSVPTDWGLREDDHVVIVHRAGRLRAMTTVFDGGPAVAALPRVGDVWVIPAGWRYDALAQGGTVSFCELRAPIELIPNASPQPAIGRNDPFLHAVTERLARTIGREDDLALMLRESLAESVRLHLADVYAGADENVRQETTGPRLDDERKRLLDERLRDTLDERHSLRSMAAFAGMGVGDFLKAFSATFGVSPRQHLIALRLERARDLLERTKAPVTDIALDVGFSTPSHFATSFRQRFGVRPTDLRR